MIGRNESPPPSRAPVAVRTNSDIPEALSELSARISGVTQRLSDLTARLSPALRAEPPHETEKSRSPQGQCEMSYAIRSEVSRVDDIEVALMDILDRLEV